MSIIADRPERVYVTFSEKYMRNYIYNILLKSNSSSRTYEGVGDLVSVLSHMRFRDRDDLEVEVDWMLKDWIDC